MVFLFSFFLSKAGNNLSPERACAPLSFMILSLSWRANGASTKLTRWNGKECSERICRPRPLARHRRRHSHSQHPLLCRVLSPSIWKSGELMISSLAGTVVGESARRDVLALYELRLKREMVNQRRAFRRQSENSIIPINAPKIWKYANSGGFNTGNIHFSFGIERKRMPFLFATGLSLIF